MSTSPETHEHEIFRMMSGRNAHGPDFICIGAQKGGTGWLYDQLALHPGFWMPPVKELHYLDRVDAQERAKAARRAEKKFGRRPGEGGSRLARSRAKSRTHFQEIDGIFLTKYIAAMEAAQDLDRYADLFEEKAGRITGDVTPGYSGLDAASVEALSRRFPDMKVVFIAREPVERFWSQYCMAIRHGSASAPVDANAVLAFAKRPFVVNRSLPSQIVSQWREWFPSDRFGLFFFDDLRSDAAVLRRRILTSLGADPDAASGEFAADYNRKKQQTKIEMSAEIKTMLVDYFSEELDRCRDQLGGPAATWRDRLIDQG